MPAEPARRLLRLRPEDSIYTQAISDATHQTRLSTISTIAEVPNDGRLDFAPNPFNGPLPAYETILANACDLVGKPAWVCAA